MPVAAGICVAGAVFCAVSVLGLAWTPRGRQEVYLTKLLLKLLGWVVLSISLLLAVAFVGGEQGAAFWFCLISVAGVTSVYSMARLPRLFPLLPPVFALFAIISGTFHIAGLES